MITARESEIVMLSESGMSVSKIAAQMGASEAYVRGRVAFLCSGLGIDHAGRRATAAGSAALLAAIERARPQGHRSTGDRA